jgi:hypothetical protein
MLKKSLLVLTGLIGLYLIGAGIFVEAAAQCTNPGTLSMSSGSNGGSSTTSTTMCYRVASFPSNTTTLTLDVTVSSGSVNVYWATGAVQSVSRRLNARKNMTGQSKLSVTISSSSGYSLAIVPTGQSTFNFTLKALKSQTGPYVPDPCGDCSAYHPTPMPECSEENGQVCSYSESTETILENYAGASVTYPFEASCRSRLEAYVSWTGGANLLELRLEDEDGYVTALQGASPLQIVYDSQPQDFANGSGWQWSLVNTGGGIVDTLNVQLGYPDESACAVDPFDVYGPEACIYGYVWREAFPGDTVCVTGDVRSQAADDNSQAVTRIDPASSYGSDGCIYGYVWREASPTDHVCVTGDVRSQAAYDNTQAAARRDTNDLPPVSDEVVVSDPTAIPVDSFVPTSVSSLAACPNSLPPHMIVGAYGRVMPGDPNTLRNQPTVSAQKIGQILAGETFYVVEGPACANNYTFWKVQYNGLEGWTAESGNGLYWLEPIAQ